MNTKKWVRENRGRLRVLFCGGREYYDLSRVREIFDYVQPSFVCTGGARGADTACSRVATERGITQVIYPANWKGEGHSAGSIRNQRMSFEFGPDLVVAFPGGTGTENMVSIAKRTGTKILRVRP